MKYEWKKQEKALYSATQTPRVIHVSAQSYLMISGRGNPNSADFSSKVSALYTLAYAVKGVYKALAAKAGTPNGVHDFSVYPLEGIWEQKQGGKLVKEALEYTIMIRQPDFITKDMVAAALEAAKKKKPCPLYGDVRFDAMQDGKCIEILHIGPYDEEAASFSKMAQFAEENGLTRSGSWHREIYLNNASRVGTGKLKTILRMPVQSTFCCGCGLEKGRSPAACSAAHNIEKEAPVWYT